MTLEDFGLSGPVLVAGFFGGVCYIAVPGTTPKPGAAIGSLLTSTFTAAYVTGVATKYLGAPELFCAWFVGLSATWICKKLISKAKSWDPTTGGSLDDK